MKDAVKPNLKLAGFSLLTILLLVVILQNTQPVETKLLLWQFTLPRALLLLLTLLVGFASGYVFAVFRKRHKPAERSAHRPTATPSPNPAAPKPPTAD